MRSLPQLQKKNLFAPPRRTKHNAWFVGVLLATGTASVGCAGVAAGPTPPPPPPPAIQVSVFPSASSVLLGNTQLFKANVNGTTDTSVSWSVNGVAGGDDIAGKISADGTYTAPANLPAAPASVQISATSHADATKSGSAKINLVSDVTVGALQGQPSVELGATRAFQAVITSSGHPNTTLAWSVSGSACASDCGSVDSNGDFTAPQILPAPPAVTLTATSVADSTKRNSAAVTITSNFTLVLTAPARAIAGSSIAIVATLTPVPNSNPSRTLNWSVTGAGCSGVACGTVTPQSNGSGAAYTAPQVLPSPPGVTVTVTPLADPSKKTQAAITLQSGASLSLSPATATVAANHRITLLATTPDATANFNWTANGILGGNAATGQICVANSTPCQPVTTGNISQVDYLAPGGIPGGNPVRVSVTNAADATQSSAAEITIINHVLVSVLPGNVTLPPLGVQGFVASVLGAVDQRVIWRVQGPACANVGACGAINSSGTYTAPAAAPAPNAVQVVAISSDDNSQSGIANVTISTGANILTLHPASVYTGGANGFTLRADGSGFNNTAAGSGSTLLIAGTPRITSCASNTQCSAPVTPADVSQTGSVSVQIRNPDGTTSNALNLLVVAPGVGPEIISLTNDAPVATEKNITVVDPTTAGLDTTGFNLDISVAALGTFLTASNTCNLGGSPIALARPASGAVSADICIFSQSSFDTSMTFTVSGSGDIAVISKEPAGLGIIHLTLAIPASALPGARTIFVENANLDETAASGVLQIY